jgi:cytochrome b/b6/petB-like protein
MRILKTNPVLTILNSYLVDNPQPSTISYLWNFGSLLGLSLVVQIITGILLAMHYTGTAELGFNSVEHIMRDVNAGWLLRMSHANMASFFFIAVYLHISKGLYYGSYRSPRIGVWVIGTVIFFLMMATYREWPKWILVNDIKVLYLYLNDILPFNKAKTKGIHRIGPHNIDVLSVLICGMLSDWWADK